MIARVVLSVMLALFGLWLVSYFIPALLWAVIIAIAIDPLFVRIQKRWPRVPDRSLLPAGMTLAVALLILAPIAIGLTEAVREAYDVLNWLSAVRTTGIPEPAWVAHLSIGSTELSQWWAAHLATPAAAARQLDQLNGATVMTHTQLVGKGLMHRVVVFAFTLIALFSLLRNRVSVISQCQVASDRLLGPAGERIGHQAIRSVRGVIDGLVLVGIAEGVVITIAYAVFGVPHAILLGLLTAVAAMIPFGAAFVLAVAAVLLIAKDMLGSAIAVFAIGLTVVGIADHFFRPVLIGTATRLPFLWVFIGIFGGVESLGLLGLFVGPATAAILLMLWREFIQDPRAEPTGLPDLPTAAGRQ